MSISDLNFARNTSCSCRPAVHDWLETQSRIIGFWIDRLIAEGDESEIVSMLHCQQSWLAQMNDTLRRDRD